jgi:hypothetical protein
LNRVVCGGQERHTATGQTDTADGEKAAPCLSSEGLPIDDLPLQAQVSESSRPTFKAEVWLWFQLRPVIELLEGILREAPSIRQTMDDRHWNPDALISTVARLVQFPPPDQWMVCRTCQGEGLEVADKDCGDCGGGGYLYE